MQSSVKISGVKETISELRKLEPELLKQMRKDIKKEPGIVNAISLIKSKAPAVAPLSGMTHSGRTSYAKPRVSASFRPSVRLDKVNQRSIISINTTPPKDQAGFEIIDMAGRGGGKTRKTTTRPYQWKGITRTHSITTQGRGMIQGLASSPSRYVWKAIEGKQASLSNAALNIIERYASKVNVKLRTK
jgi:hypothetical protein